MHTIIVQFCFCFFVFVMIPHCCIYDQSRSIFPYNQDLYLQLWHRLEHVKPLLWMELVRGGGVNIRRRVAITGRIKRIWLISAMLLDKCQSGGIDWLLSRGGCLTCFNTTIMVRDSFFDMSHQKTAHHVASSRRRHRLFRPR